MKLLKRQQGLPFLLALGVLFILSASFLAVQIWSDDFHFRGAAAALEAPVLPPSLNAPTIVPPPEAREADIQNESEPEAPAVVAPVVSEDTEKEAKPRPAKKAVEEAETAVVKQGNKPQLSVVSLEKPQNVKLTEAASTSFIVVEETQGAEPVKTSEKAVVVKPVDAVESEKPVVKTVAAKTTPKVEAVAAEVKQKPAVKKVQAKASVLQGTPKKPEPVVKATVEPVLKAKPVRKIAKKQPVPTEVPPEWNWFSTPLKMKMSEGKVELVPSQEVKSLSLGARTTVAIPVEVKVALQAPQTKDVQVSIQKPFARALAKMAQIKQKRSLKAASDAKPEKVKKESVSMRRLRDMVRHICSQSSDSPKNTEMYDAAKIDEEVLTAETKAIEPIKPYVSASESMFAVKESVKEPRSYTGSGSNFSNRIQELIRSGAWLKD
jgi:hypothetical protein